MRRKPRSFAALSRVPVADHPVIPMGAAAMVPSREVSLLQEGRPLALLGTHTLPPVDGATTAIGDAHPIELAKCARTSTRASGI